MSRIYDHCTWEKVKKSFFRIVVWYLSHFLICIRGYLILFQKGLDPWIKILFFLFCHGKQTRANFCAFSVNYLPFQILCKNTSTLKIHDTFQKFLQKPISNDRRNFDYFELLFQPEKTLEFCDISECLYILLRSSS